MKLECFENSEVDLVYCILIFRFVQHGSTSSSRNPCNE